LTDYKGTLLLVSHDRDFLDNVVTSSLVIEGAGRVGEYVGGYSDYLRQRPAAMPETAPARKAPKAKTTSPKATPPALSTTERKELRDLPRRIDRIETELARYETQFAEPGFYERGDTKVA